MFAACVSSVSFHYRLIGDENDLWIPAETGEWRIYTRLAMAGRCVLQTSVGLSKESPWPMRVGGPQGLKPGGPFFFSRGEEVRHERSMERVCPGHLHGSGRTPGEER